MISKDTRYDRILERFEQAHPYMAENATHWMPAGRTSVVITMNTGRRFIYEAMDDTIRLMSFSPDTPLNEEEWKAEFKNRLKDAMRLAHTNQRELAERVGLSPAIISKYINGKSIPNVYHLNAIASALDCSLSELTDF